MNHLKFNSQKSRAQAIVEFAIVLPVLLLVVYGLIETGRFIFIVSSVNNATRQAARYGSTSGTDSAYNVPRYQACAGIRQAANNSDFLNAFTDADITITYDRPTSGNPNPTDYDTCDGTADTGVSAITGDRINVTINYRYNAIVPSLVPFISRTMTASSSRTLLLTISVPPPKTPTVTLITADTPDPSEIGGYVAVTVQVTATSSTPTGTVNITGADENCTITLSSGTGTCNVRFTSIGEKTITADYTGDANHDASSDTEVHTVNPASTVTTITADSPDPSVPNQSVNVAVTVSTAWGTATGTVSITGADTNCTITLSGGAGNCNVNFASTGTKTLTASYNGDTEHAASNDTEGHTVLPPGVTTTIITSDNPDPSQVGEAVAVFVTVTGSSTTPTGTVEITGADTNCTITLSGGTGSCNVVFNSTGSKTLTATYGGDANNSGSSDTESHTVSLPAAITNITSDLPDPSNPGQAVSVTVVVSGGSTTPTGTVAITGADTNCTITLSGGTGSCNIVFNTTGSKTITATYSGDGTHGGSTDTEPHTVAVVAPSIPNCNTLSVATHLSKLKMLNGRMVINITNPFAQLLQISTIKVTWNHDKGHQTGTDKTLILDKVYLGGGVIWDGNEIGPDAIIIPTSAATIPANSTSALEFLFHQTFDRWDNTESVELFFANPGCETVTLKQTAHE
ncbi:MAG: Ig-like domain repeat protein [Chloroflexi bacterium]|nr:Ig-like domain repeat protein [Chloroflexota bacterium]